jgi:hypothetical protein
MKQVTLNIPDSKFQFFVELATQLGLEIHREKTLDINLPQWQLDELDKRVADYESNSDIALDFNHTMDEIEKNN